LENTVNEQQQRLALVMDPAIRVATLADPKAASKAAAKVYWQEATKSGLIVVSNVEPVLKGQGKSLELWAICGDKPPAPAGIFWTDASGHGSREVKLMGDLACVDKFAVSVEATDNVPLPSPKGSIVLVGQ
jgi:anti-sigma-K factor RskA